MNDRHRPHPEGFLKRNGRAVVGAATLSVVIAGAGWWVNTSVLHSTDGLVARTKTVIPPAAGDLDQSPQLSDPTERPHADTVKAARSINLIPVNGGEPPAPVDVTEKSATPTRGVPRIGAAAIAPVSVGATGELGTAVTAADIAMRPSLKYAKYRVGIDRAAAPPATKIALSIPVVTLDGYRKLPAKSAGVAPAKSPPVPVDGKGIDIALVREALRLEEARRFTMSMCRDLTGCLWVGTEDGGVQRFDPSAPELKQWTQFTTKDGLGDDNGYAIACDRLGRIWVGHLNHGVSVYNGQKWQNYEVVGGLSDSSTMSGPLGERVFAIALSPADGDIWIGTNRGIARYSVASDNWSYFTRAQGLSSDQINAIALDADGTVYCGTDCHGINVGIASPDGQHRLWREIPVNAILPTEATGVGLPTGEINDLLVTPDGCVVAATNAGIAWSTDKGKQWRYRHGENWAARNGTRNPVSIEGCVAEDYVTCLAGKSLNDLYIGYRQKHAEAIDLSRGIRHRLTLPSAFVTAISIEGGEPVIGSYGNGVLNPANHPTLAATVHTTGTREFPSPATDTIATIRKMLHEVNTSKCESRSVVLLDDDWMTQGDEIGRYGREYSLLCGMSAPYNDRMYLYTGGDQCSITGQIGPRMPKDKIRTFITNMTTTDRRSLYAPRKGCRRQAEYDDHGEAYSMDEPGPDLWLTVTVTSGVHRLSLYFVNNDSHADLNACRDYRIEVKSFNSNLALADNAPPLVTSRVSQFWGGVYKRFLLTGPNTYLVHIRRNGVNTILSGAFLDQVSEPDQTIGRPLPYMGFVNYDPPGLGIGGNKTSLWFQPDISRLFAPLDTNSLTETDVDQLPYAILGYRCINSYTADKAVKDLIKWKLCLWDVPQRQCFTETMSRASVSLSELNKIPR